MAKHPSHAKLSSGGSGNSEKVLELGCGPGKYVAMLSNLGFVLLVLIQLTSSWRYWKLIPS